MSSHPKAYEDNIARILGLATQLVADDVCYEATPVQTLALIPLMMMMVMMMCQLAWPPH